MRRFGRSEREQELVWELWGDGTSSRAVARKLGARPEYVRRHVTSTGGVKPAARRRSERCLSKREREEISRGLARRESCRAIAAAIGRPHTTVSRKVSRNGGRGAYRALMADEAAWGRARRPKRAKLAVNSGCGRWWRRSSRWTGRRSRSRPGLGAPILMMWRCGCRTRRSTCSLFVQSRGALRPELCAHLRRGRRTRRPRGRPAPQARGQIREMVMISERPAEVEDRAVPGHWEGDLLLDSRASGIATPQPAANLVAAWRRDPCGGVSQSRPPRAPRTAVPESPTRAS